MSSVRFRRLSADFDNLKRYVNRHPRLRLIQTAGEPPERYQLQFQIRSLRQTGDELVEVREHVVEISLPRNYPRTPPLCRMLTPVFHPNIAPHAICVGDHWSPGEPLWGMVARIGEMLAYQSYNTKSPLNGEAARWVDEHIEELPLDKVSMLVDQSDAAPQGAATAAAQRAPAAGSAVAAPAPPPVPQAAIRPAPAARPSVAPPPGPSAVSPPAATRAETRPPAPSKTAQVRVRCPECEANYRMTPPTKQVQVRCPKCQAQFSVGPRPASPGA